MLLLVCAFKEDCCSEKEGGSGKEHCQKKGPQQVLSVAWLASTQVCLVYHSLSTKIDTAHSYLRNMKLCFEPYLRVEFEQSWGEKQHACAFEVLQYEPLPISTFVRARGVHVYSEIGVKIYCPIIVRRFQFFSLGARGLPFSLSPAPESLISSFNWLI